MVDLDTTTDRATRSSARPRRRRMGWILVLLVIGAVAAGIWWWLGTSDDPGATTATDEPTQFAEVTRRDLETVETFDGTLGSVDGDPVLAQRQGTITGAAPEGSVVGSGEVLFDIDGEPVPLLIGAVPAYRTMEAIVETDTVAAAVSGTVTAVPEEGTLVSQGDVLFEIDGEPVILLYGDVPFYRTMVDLSTNMEGDDILQLENALTELGYNDGVATVDGEFSARTEDIVEDFEEAIGRQDPDGVVRPGEIVFLPGPVEIDQVVVTVGAVVAPGTPVLAVADLTDGGTEGIDVLQLESALARLGFDASGTMVVDGVFTAETRSAVESFQEAVGMDADGVVDLGDIVFLPEPIFVSEQLLTPGSPVNHGSPVLGVSDPDKVVTVDLPAADQEDMSVGQSVIVELPDNTRVPATVESIASIATAGVTGQGATFEVVIRLDDPDVASGLDEAPVDVEVVTDGVENVIAVPVTALLALREGGYAVEVARNDTTVRIAVEPGFFADGFVEIESGDVQPGDRVVVP